ncbi:hypothetical protein EVAR_68887_1 [Eumeta japonica]|uniref:Uncharacterized protein n=1 Tax=Eumeta variegata TaxID=151549 RepID=A0A4C1ZXT4_EUMVA|nr:hypothetical protein EVAR_68887_1 [Eumeta japonica]
MSCPRFNFKEALIPGSLQVTFDTIHIPFARRRRRLRKKRTDCTKSQELRKGDIKIFRKEERTNDLMPITESSRSPSMNVLNPKQSPIRCRPFGTAIRVHVKLNKHLHIRLPIRIGDPAVGRGAAISDDSASQRGRAARRG